MPRVDTDLRKLANALSIIKVMMDAFGGLRVVEERPLCSRHGVRADDDNRLHVADHPRKILDPYLRCPRVQFARKEIFSTTVTVADVHLLRARVMGGTNGDVGIRHQPLQAASVAL